MATIVLTDAVVTINSVDLSDHITKITFHGEVDDVDNTAFGSQWRTRQGGLKDGSVEIEFNQDYASAKVDATVWPLFGTTTTVTAKATSAANSATNPQYSASVLVREYSPLDGSVGDLNKTSVSWPTNGAISRATS
ncbi:hypothetical protein ACIBI0_38420 [Microbispora rosea]|uniref:hypothetical protein n=1 Tax=Microbispora rosea TaxID=58117 RepID=UPI0037971A0C